MAKITELTVEILHLRALVSFMDVRQGEESFMPLDGTVQGWINAGLAVIVDEAVHSGPDQVGPSSPEPDIPGDIQE